jgi:UrcA family protein
LEKLKQFKEMTMNTLSTRTAVRRIAATVLFGALGAGLTAVASAKEDGFALSQVVKYGDLNVSNAQGASTLYARIRAAAANVCRPLAGQDFPPRLHDQCMHKAITDAVNKVDQPALTAVYNEKNGIAKPVVLASSTR